MKRLDSQSSRTPTPGKVPYRAPELTAYGSLKERTKGGTLYGNDGNNECTGNANVAKEECGTS